VKRSLSGWILSCILSTATLASGQIATTSLRGTIKDSSGAVLPGARITIVDKANGNGLSATASSAGFYEFPQIQPATYTITANAPGFGDQIKVAELLVNQPATIDFTLTVQSSTVTVDVSAEAQTLNTTDASLGSSADNELIQALPSETRNVPDLLSLQPGVLYLPMTSDSRSGAVNGGRSDQGNVTIDGIDDNDQVNGYAFNGVLRETQDSIEEFRVTTSDANSDQGRSSGAQVSMLTKSGTNKFHGATYWYYRPPLTAANNWFNKQAEVEEGEPNIPSKVLRNIFGADVGGPIKRDKVFFFANYEGQRLAENAEPVQTVPTANYAKGIISYTDLQGNTQALSPAQIKALDANCQVCNTPEYPLPQGVNPNALSFFSAYPTANGTLTGDALNEGSFAFSSPNPQTLNTSIVRLDFTPNDRHRIFARGNLQKDTVGYPEQFPGQGPSQVYEDNSKGMAFADTWTIKSNLINDLHYGYIRQGYSFVGPGVGDFVDFRFLTNPTSELRSTATNVPVNNIIDNLNWTKGRHSIQFGANWRLIHQNHVQNTSTWQGASTNPYWLNGNPPGNNAVQDSFQNSYEIAFANMVGTVPSLTNSYNYHVDSASSGTLLADGAFLKRNFSTNEYEWYVQDAWHPTSKLVLTVGLRHTILDTPWETTGQQVAPTTSSHEWSLARESAAQSSQIYEPNLLFSPIGHYYNKPGFWPKSKDNFAPRFAFAYSPDAKTSLRGGFGIYFDHYGEALVETYDLNGSFGISSEITNPASVYQIEGTSSHPGSPRFLGRHTLPAINNGGSPQTQTYPYLPPDTPATGFAISWGLDDKLKTPYSESFDLSVQRQLPGGFMLETSYVGRLGRHLIQSLDIAEPVDYIDPSGGGDYYAAGTQLSRDVDANGGNDGLYNGTPNSPHVSPIPYFENVFGFMKNYDFAGESATQAIYNNEWAPYRAQYGATTSLSDLDVFGPYFGYYPAPPSWQPHFWQNQFSSLYVLSTIGMSYYNAGQFTLRHPASHGFQMAFTYTLSRSIDMGSDAERSGGWASDSFSNILNTWKPYLNRGLSDFNTTHLITTDYVYQLPFGRGKAVLGNANKLTDVFVGGWQWSGIFRMSSGLPFSLFEPGWSTDWQIESYAVKTGNVQIKRHYDSAGNPQFFAGTSAQAINAGVATGSPVRLPYPGEAGERNNFIGDGYLDLASGVNKSWKIRESNTLKFAWEVYNVTNTVRFDPASIGSGLTGGNLGIASSLLTAPRRMQFSLRYDF